MSQFTIDSFVRVLLQVIASVSVLIVALIVVFLCVESKEALNQIGFRFVRDASWHPHEYADQGRFGLLPILLGTLMVSVGAILIAAPVGVASAIFSQFYAPVPIAFVYRRMVELLVGIPSVVFGFWGLVVLCPFIAMTAKQMGWPHVLGPSVLAATIIVAMMILPTVMLISESAIKGVHSDYIFGAVATGMGRLAIIKNIVLPQAKVGIVTGVVLGLARALGETMAVVMVAGNVVRIPSSVFDPVCTLTANIALEMGYALGVHRSALFFCGLLLLASVALVFSLEIVLRRVVWRTQP